MRRLLFVFVVIFALGGARPPAGATTWVQGEAPLIIEATPSAVEPGGNVVIQGRFTRDYIPAGTWVDLITTSGTFTASRVQASGPNKSFSALLQGVSPPATVTAKAKVTSAAGTEQTFTAKANIALKIPPPPPAPAPVKPEPKPAPEPEKPKPQPQPEPTKPAPEPEKPAPEPEKPKPQPQPEKPAPEPQPAPPPAPEPEKHVFPWWLLLLLLFLLVVDVRLLSVEGEPGKIRVKRGWLGPPWRVRTRIYCVSPDGEENLLQELKLKRREEVSLLLPGGAAGARVKVAFPWLNVGRPKTYRREGGGNQGRA